jgi:hypothetical protein
VSTNFTRRQSSRVNISVFRAPICVHDMNGAVKFASFVHDSIDKKRHCMTSVARSILHHATWNSFEPSAAESWAFIPLCGAVSMLDRVKNTRWRAGPHSIGGSAAPRLCQRNPLVHRMQPQCRKSSRKSNDQQFPNSHRCYHPTSTVEIDSLLILSQVCPWHTLYLQNRCIQLWRLRINAT